MDTDTAPQSLTMACARGADPGGRGHGKWLVKQARRCRPWGRYGSPNLISARCRTPLAALVETPDKPAPPSRRAVGPCQALGLVLSCHTGLKKQYCCHKVERGYQLLTRRRAAPPGPTPEAACRRPGSLKRTSARASAAGPRLSC